MTLLPKWLLPLQVTELHPRFILNTADRKALALARESVMPLIGSLILPAGGLFHAASLHFTLCRGSAEGSAE